MKIKIGDIPLRIYNKICEPNRYGTYIANCEACPFAIRIDDGFFRCKGIKSEYQDEMIEIPDKLFNKETKE